MLVSANMFWAAVFYIYILIHMSVGKFVEQFQ